MSSTRLAVGALALLAGAIPALAQSVLFTFDNAPPYTPLPLNVVVDGLTASLSATGQGYSIQSAGAVPVVPVGFSGNFIYPSSIYGADLIVAFDQPITAFSIQYATYELACDDSATVRVTASMNSTYVGTNTANATPLCVCTYTVNTLAFSSPQAFNHVVIRYDQRPATCQDYVGIIFMDNMQVTLASSPPVCYANCDGSTGTPALTAADFSCFLTRFRAGDAYANCDGSTGTPSLTAADFTCFLAAFRGGCP